MSLRDAVLESLSQVMTVSDIDDGVLVTMPCLYPSNGLVQLRVSGGPHEYRVSDGGGSLKEIEGTGVETELDVLKTLKRAVEAHGLRLLNGVIHAPTVNEKRLGSALALVANASKDAAEWFYNGTRIRRRKNFKEQVMALLERTFEPDQVIRSGIVQGASSKPHHFDAVVEIGGGKRLVVDAVVNDGNSVNSAVATNVDVKTRNDETLVQRIIYDDQDTWGTSDLNMLALGGTLIPFSRSPEAFAKFTRLAQR